MFDENLLVVKLISCSVGHQWRRRRRECDVRSIDCVDTLNPHKDVVSNRLCIGDRQNNPFSTSRESCREVSYRIAMPLKIALLGAGTYARASYLPLLK